MQNGWALQSGTSHFLGNLLLLRCIISLLKGQNFAKAFDVYFQDKNNIRELVRFIFWIYIIYI